MTHTRTSKLIALASLALFAAAALGFGLLGGNDYDLSWNTIDGGGGTSTGGTFSLASTIGQHDAGGTMSGTTFALTGGFWAGGAVPATEIAILTDVMVIEGTHNSGGLPQLNVSDNQYYQASHRITGEAAETHRLQYVLGAATTLETGDQFTITFEGRTDDPITVVTLFLKDWNGPYEQVTQFGQGLNDTTRVIGIADANQYIRASDGRIEMLVKKHIVLPSALGGTPSYDDLIAIAVQQ